MDIDSKPFGVRAGRGDTEVTVFGRRSVLEALASPSVEVLEVRADKRAIHAIRRELLAACRARGVAPEFVSGREVSALSREPRHDQGVAVRLRLLKIMEIDALLDRFKGRGARSGAQLLAFDGLTNPQNLGMIVRSAVAAGIDAVLWPLVGSPWISGLVVKASVGAVFGCPIARCQSLPLALGELQGRGFEVIGLGAEADVSLFDKAPPARAVWVIGGETTGIGDDVVALLDARVAIPMEGGVESLNAAVAASLVCFHAAGRLGKRAE